MTSPNSWLVRRPRPHGLPAPRRRLVCFAYAGGSASSFHDWPSALPSDLDVCAVQLPGRGSRFREPTIGVLGELLDRLVPALTFPDALPTYFFGHSLGALLSFEVARRPDLPCRDALAGLVMSGASAPRLRGPSRGMHLLDDAALTAELENYNGTPPEVLAHRELMELVLPAIRADFALVERYQYAQAAPLQWPMAVFAGERDDFVSAAQVEGWRAETSGPFEIHSFPGDHFFLQGLRDEVLARLDEVLSRWRIRA